MSKAKAVYKRVVLKLSGEAMQGSRGYGIDSKALRSIAQQIKEIVRLGLQIAVVIGGGNIFRGAEGTKADGIDRSTSPGSFDSHELAGGSIDGALPHLGQ